MFPTFYFHKNEKKYADLKYYDRFEGYPVSFETIEAYYPGGQLKSGF